MRRRNATILLGLALLFGVTLSIELSRSHWMKVYQLTVSIYPGLHLSQGQVEDIFKCASGILQGNSNIVPQHCPLIEPHNNCKVGFKFKAFVDFPSSAPVDITNKKELEAVHEVPADVKVVRSIKFCAQEGSYLGCAWRPGDRQRTVILASEGISFGVGPVVLAHEFGHTTGLIHRYQNPNLNLMTPCPQPFNQQVDNDECRHFLAGPVRHYPPTAGPTICANSSARPLTD